MVIDIIYFKVYPNPTGVAGYLLVFFSVIGMAASDKIQNWINNLSYCTKIRYAYSFPPVFAFIREINTFKGVLVWLL